jgi:hypothetical protein
MQHQILQAQVGHQTLQPRVLLLQLLQPPGLIHLQPAKLTPPTARFRRIKPGDGDGLQPCSHRPDY